MDLRDEEIEKLSVTNTIDDGIQKCDTLTPIYPVRYGYANLFDDISPAVAPPSVQDLLNASSLEQSQGYIIRLLREGWIYIREEGNNNFLHIFKYSQTTNGDQVTEQFEKYLFTNGQNAQGGLSVDHSSGFGHYPFAFVSVGTSNVSIAYSQHAWSANVIDRMHQSRDARTQAMQQVNLVTDISGHTVDATKENLEALVEDYRQKRNKMLALNEAAEHSEAAKLSLDLLTTEQSYTISPEKIASLIQSKLCYREKGKIVALHDPIGRQLEIAQAHAKLALWEQDYASLNIYPYMTGQFVDSFLKSDNEDVREAAEDNINIEEHSQYWQEMHQQHDIFKTRRKAFAELYANFMYPNGDPTLFQQPGSLDTYFAMFFDYAPNDDAQAEAELVKLAALSASLFEGFMASAEGKAALEAMIAHAHTHNGDTSIENTNNVYAIMIKGLSALITHPHSEFDWAVTTAQALDKLLNSVGLLWGEMAAWGQYSAQLAKRKGNFLTAGALQYTIDKLIPNLLKVFGLTIDHRNQVQLSNNEMARVLAKALENSIATGGHSGLAVFEQATRKLERAQRLFDWSNTQRETTLKLRWNLAKVLVTRAPGSRFQFYSATHVTQKIGILFDSHFTGLSAFFNISTMVALSNQSRFDYANPIAQGSALHSSLRFSTALAALTVDTMSLSRLGVQGLQMGTNVLPASVATRMIPALNTGAQYMGRLVMGKLAGSLVAIANFIGAATAIWDTARAMETGNHGEAAGHAAVALGSAILFVGAAQSLAATGAITSGSAVGLPIGVVCFALALVVGGAGLLFVFSKNPLENLLFQCFWGKSENYAFWIEIDRRPPIAKRFDSAGKVFVDEVITLAYQRELQEFMNFLAMPQLKLDRYSGGSRWWGTGSGARNYDLRFTLPQFQWGVSELIAGVYRARGFDMNGHISTQYDPELTQAFTTAVQAALANPQNVVLNRGVLTLSLRLTVPSRVHIFWYYQPIPQLVVPLRLLSRAGQLKPEPTLIAGMINENTL